MKTQSLFHKLKSIVGYSIAVVVIFVAIAVSGLRFILTTANLYQTEVEELASSLLKQPVKIGRMDAKLIGLIPTLIFYDVELISKKKNKVLFSLVRLDVGISYEDLIFEQTITPVQLTVRGLDLHVTRTKQGKFKVKGVDLESLNAVESSDSNSIVERWLSQESEVGLEDSRITWKDEKNSGLTWSFENLKLLLRNSSGRHQLTLSSKLPKALGSKIDLFIDLEGNIATPETWKAKTYIESKKVNLALLNKYIKVPDVEIIDGYSDFKIWGDVEDKKLSHLSGNVALQNFTYQYKNKEAVSLKHISNVFDSRRDKAGRWNVSVENFNYESNEKVLADAGFALAFKYEGNKLENAQIKSQHVDLNSLSKIVSDLHLISRKSERRIHNLNLKGSIEDLYFSLNNNVPYQLEAKFKGVSANAWNSMPKLENLSGHIEYKDNEGSITLASKNSMLGFPQLFRDNFIFNTLDANVLFLNTKKGILFNIEHLVAVNNEVDAKASAKLWLPSNEKPPHLDMQVYVSKGDASKLPHYLPVGIMGGSLVNYLDNSILSGKADKGTVIFNGKLNSFPFNHNEGVFLVNVDASDVEINYQKDWPKITKAKVSAIFTSQGMKIHLINGQVNNNLIYNSFAEIPSFENAELKLDLSTKGSTHNTMDYLVNSPILLNAKNNVSLMRWGGDVLTSIKLNIPLDSDIKKKKSLSYSGSSKLFKASLFMLDDKVDIDNASGTLLYTEKGFTSKNLVADILGEKSQLSVNSDLKNKDIKISTATKLAPNIILKRFNIPGANKISGIADFNIDMLFPGNKLKSRHAKLTLTSDLFGIKSTLPEQFYKNKNKLQPFRLTTIFTGGNKFRIGTVFGKKGSSILELKQSKKYLYLNKGAISASNKKAVLPRKNILYIDGSINRFTPSKWFKALGLDKESTSKPFLINPIIFNLSKLKILTAKINNKTSSKVSIPQRLPIFEGIIKKLYYNKKSLGRIDFKTSKKKSGLRFDEIILSSKNTKILTNGDWDFKSGAHSTSMDITLSSTNFGGMLSDYGFQDIIRGGTAIAVGKLSWKDAPTNFSFAKLNGKIQLNTEDGNITKVDAGAGRLLGFFSLSALPRKLLGDFKDSFKDGFSFDTANGEINIEEGDAYTEDFEIISPIAEISLSGRTGLVDKDYDNTVVVVPKVGGGVAGVTALLVNLPAGIGLWLLDKLTGEQFNEASAKTYEITGSWKIPDVEEVTEE